MTTIVSIDPGITTGYAIIDLQGRLLESGNLSPEDISESILARYVESDDVEVVVELVPIPTTGKMNQELLDVISTINQMFPHAIKISPGTWKQIGPVVNYPITMKGMIDEFSDHQKDAFRMGIYYLIYKRGEPIDVKRSKHQDSIS